jgi:hypothetical protein
MGWRAAPASSGRCARRSRHSAESPPTGHTCVRRGSGMRLVDRSLAPEAFRLCERESQPEAEQPECAEARSNQIPPAAGGKLLLPARSPPAPVRRRARSAGRPARRDARRVERHIGEPGGGDARVVQPCRFGQHADTKSQNRTPSDPSAPRGTRTLPAPRIGRVTRGGRWSPRGNAGTERLRVGLASRPRTRAPSPRPLPRSRSS